MARGESSQENYGRLVTGGSHKARNPAVTALLSPKGRSAESYKLNASQTYSIARHAVLTYWPGAPSWRRKLR